jgi:hypothetical protein
MGYAHASGHPDGFDLPFMYSPHLILRDGLVQLQFLLLKAIFKAFVSHHASESIAGRLFCLGGGNFLIAMSKHRCVEAHVLQIKQHAS